MTLARWRVVLWLTVCGAALLILFVASSALVPFAVGGVVGYALLPVVERPVDKAEEHAVGPFYAPLRTAELHEMERQGEAKRTLRQLPL